jgi:2-C-methyl-D-erythritol 4-phosphate cytidylyltransferase
MRRNSSTEGQQGPRLTPRDDIWGIVLAAGSGSRFGERKQFLEINGSRLVDLAVALTASFCQGVVLVLPAGFTWDGDPVAAVVSGGDLRTDSTRRGLDAVPASAQIILTHDAVHPLASKNIFVSLIEAIQEDGVDAVLPAISTRDTIMRMRRNEIVEAVPRNGLVWVQMPYAFRADALRAAHQRGGEAQDDGVLVQQMGGRIKTVPGEPSNIHVTTRDDLAIVRRLMTERPSSVE